MAGSSNIKNFLTIDVEDYYHVSAFEHLIGHEKWDDYDSRVVDSTKAILDMLDQTGIKATFFVLGWIAERYPDLVRDIHGRGHEIGCHSYYHRLIYNISPEEFKNDTQRSKDVLEQITGEAVLGYRAPSYSITDNTLWALDILEDTGFKYDSSIFPIVHDRYGIPDAPRFMYKLPKNNLIEYPISTAVLSGIRFPVSGGGYFRLFPYNFTKWMLGNINRTEGQPFVFYIHPWEVDPLQPRINGTGLISRFRHYVNLQKTLSRFRKLLLDFEFVPISGSNNIND